MDYCIPDWYITRTEFKHTVNGEEVWLPYININGEPRRRVELPIVPSLELAKASYKEILGADAQTASEFVRFVDGKGFVYTYRRNIEDGTRCSSELTATPTPLVGSR